MRITLAHSPDADDAFMFYGIAKGLVDTRGLEFVHELKDIQTLNEAAREGVYDVTAISVAAYPEVADKYQILTCGASMGDGYGPIVVSARPMLAAELKDARLAIPGEKTSAYLALRLFMQPDKPNTGAVFFDDIPRAVLSGEYDAGVLIHEGQLTYADDGLHLIVDLGVWWKEKTDLPLPLGVNAVRRSLPNEVKVDIARVLHAGIKHSLDYREDALTYALSFGRGLETGKADRFVGMYVNEMTLDIGDAGKEAVRLFLKEGYPDAADPRMQNPDFIEPA
jgi:1,4-dihydroxy-6-naphthoate synthase